MNTDKKLQITRREFLAGLASLAGSAALAGCGVTPTAVPTAAATSVPLPTAPLTGGGKKRGGTLTLGMSADFTQFDPYSLAFQNYPFVMNIYDSLLRYDAQGKPIPALVEKWAPAPDGKSVTLSLRKGVKFHSGKELVADDIVKNFQKAGDKDKGYNQYSNVANVDKVTTTDANTLVIQFKKVTPEMTDILENLTIIDPAAFDDLKTRGSGTGPFKFSQWVPGDRTVTEAFADYWKKPAPFLDKLIFKVFGDSDAMIAALQSGLVDMATNLPPKDVSRLSQDFNVVHGNFATTTELRINPTRPPFDNKEVRQAFQYAVDRQAIVDRALFGLGKAAAVPFAPTSPAYDPTYLQRVPYDPNKAKDLLVKSGVTNLKATCLIVQQLPYYQPIGELVKADLAKVGFDLQLELQDATAGYPRVLSGDFDILVSQSSYSHKYPTQITLNSIYRVSDNVVWHANLPKAYSDAIADASSTMDPAKQKEAFKRIADVLLDESWCISLAHPQAAFALAKYVQGFAATVDDWPMFENVSIEK